MRDHPRMRGEHLGKPFELVGWQGSSPHARGTLAGNMTVRVSPGIIPACAGNTVQSGEDDASPVDHPRMRGEHFSWSMTVSDSSGSSPHARGTLDDADWDAEHAGIIPACAGNTQASRRSTVSQPDHPRMRGEHGIGIGFMPCFCGSSPHARGTPVGTVHAPRLEGIIPACAGNTRPASTRTDRRWDHPRMRGEHTPRIIGRRRGGGSSPHARGTRGSGTTGCHGWGIIPACAGNTSKDKLDPAA